MKLTTSLALFLLTLTLLAAHAYAQSTQTSVPTSGTTSSRLGSISGRVVADGQPVTDATVSVSHVNSPGQSRAVPTNDNGDFEVKGLQPGIYRVRATAPSYANQPTDSDQAIHRVGDSIMLNLVRGGVITGKVLTGDGEPVVAVRVHATMIRDINGRPPSTLAAPATDRLTDDRGIYRIFGLLPGTYVVSAGGRGTFGYGPNAYDNDPVTYAPSSTRDAAEEISIGSGEEKTIDIRYRADAGHSISGNAVAPTSPNSPWITIHLLRLIDSAPDVRVSTSQRGDIRGFEFHGVADGDYLIWAQYASASGERYLSELRRISVKGENVSGIELSAKALASVAGELLLEPSTLSECKDKRRPLFEEAFVALQGNHRKLPKDRSRNQQPELPLYNTSEALPDKTGSFLLRNLVAGQYSFDVRFFARYWYLRSITLRPAATKGATTTDLARTWLTLKSGDRVTGLKATLAEGAASINGKVEMPGDRTLGQIVLYVVPAEKDKSDEVLRYFAVQVDIDGSFSVEHLSPGRYWLVAKPVTANDPSSTTNLRLPDAAEARMKVRRDAEAAQLQIELKPCQNLKDYKLELFE